MTNYQRGSAIERRAKKELEIHGWLVTKSGGSLGEFDLVALKKLPKGAARQETSGILLLQVKSGRTSISLNQRIREARRAIEAIPFDLAAHIQVWGWLHRRGWTKFERTTDGWREL